MSEQSQPNEFVLDFEKPVKVLENQIKELQEATQGREIDLSDEIKALQKKVNMLTREIYSGLNNWERVQLSRHPNRPHTVDYINMLITDFHDVAGDRRFAEDASIVAGFGYLGKQRVCVIGIEKGRKTKEKIVHNFGMPSPEGYRKAMRVMQMAARFNVPIVSFVDTPGAYPGIGAEERGQSAAIAENLQDMFEIKVPFIAVVIGEGGSGGALGVACADKVLMMEYSIYSVISPESCASILWSDPKNAEIAANNLQLGPVKALELKVIDSIISEPVGGAHKDPKKAAEQIKKTLDKEISELIKLSSDELLQKRFEKFRAMGNDTIVVENSATEG